MGKRTETGQSPRPRRLLGEQATRRWRSCANKMVLAARALSEPHSICATDLRRCHHEIPASQKREHSDGNVDTSRHSTSPPRDSCFADQHKALRLRKIRHGTKRKSLQLTCRHDLAAASCLFERCKCISSISSSSSSSSSRSM